MATLSTMRTTEAQLKRLQRGKIMVTGLDSVYCDILAKGVAAFCPCLIKNLPEAKFKSNDLISLVEDISR